MATAQRNFFDTLRQALESEGLTPLWSCYDNIGYGETFRQVLDDETTKHGRLVSIYRTNEGLYERPVHYPA